jgi:hypothetical protein
MEILGLRYAGVETEATLTGSAHSTTVLLGLVAFTVEQEVLCRFSVQIALALAPCRDRYANSRTIVAQNASRSSGLRLEISRSSTTTSSSTHSPPALRMSV